MEDSGATSEDDGLPRSPPEISFQEVAMQREASKVNETAQSDTKYIWHSPTFLNYTRNHCLFWAFCPSQYPEAKNHLSLLSLAGTGSEEDEQVMIT